VEKLNAEKIKKIIKLKNMVPIFQIQKKDEQKKLTERNTKQDEVNTIIKNI
jgi:hypothetical protein